MNWSDFSIGFGTRLDSIPLSLVIRSWHGNHARFRTMDGRYGLFSIARPLICGVILYKRIIHRVYMFFVPTVRAPLIQVDLGSGLRYLNNLGAGSYLSFRCKTFATARKK